MALIQTKLPSDLTLTSFKQVGQYLHDFFTGLGYVQTADTGQVNWSTIVAVPASTTSVYEIWRFDDALQATNPVFFRVDYINLNGSYNQMGLAFTFGQGTNGSGTMFGALPQFIVSQHTTSNQTSGVLFDCWFNGGSSWFALMMWRESGTPQPFILAVERSHDLSGNDTGDYLTVVCSSYPTVAQQTLLKYGAATMTPADNYWNVLMPHTASGTFGNYVGVSPVYPFIGKADNPMFSLIVASAADIGEGMQGKVNLYGSDHMYLFTGKQYLAKALRSTNSSCVVGMKVD